MAAYLRVKKTERKWNKMHLQERQNEIYERTWPVNNKKSYKFEKS